MRQGGTERGAAEITFFDSPQLPFGARKTGQGRHNDPIEGGAAEATTARTAETAWKASRRKEPSTSSGDRPPAADQAAEEAPSDDDHAAAFGCLVHALLALPGELDGDALQQAAQTQRLAYGLSEAEAAEAASLAERAQTLPAVAATRSADPVHRELPFTCRLDGHLVSGRIDLAYRTDGAWTLIDFKTARLADPDQAAARYREQMGRYRRALSALTGEPVSAALCLVRTGDLVPV
jgi:ATP-dependent exoDNAse (exonuclease V) beta subunit